MLHRARPALLASEKRASISKALGFFHSGKSRTGSRGPCRGCRARVCCRPRSWQGRARGRRGWGAAGGPRLAAPRAGRCRAGVGPGVPAAPSRCLWLQPRAEPCQHRREGPEVADTPRGDEGAASLPPLPGDRPGHISRPLAAKTPNVVRGCRGSGAAPQQLCQRQSSPPAPRGGPAAPARHRSSSGFFVRRDLSLLLRARTVMFLARISCQKTIPLSKSRPRK